MLEYFFTKNFYVKELLYHLKLNLVNMNNNKYIKYKTNKI